MHVVGTERCSANTTGLGGAEQQGEAAAKAFRGASRRVLGLMRCF